ncbi:hypothetical protein HMPREF9946_01966 [Acetobacteraceae bacterium AT-5844]|nr:hypothetical protein HMPREF9946_01966 [Acetobacteraceae bacterium AT-5844]
MPGRPDGVRFCWAGDRGGGGVCHPWGAPADRGGGKAGERIPRTPSFFL